MERGSNWRVVVEWLSIRDFVELASWAHDLAVPEWRVAVCGTIRSRDCPQPDIPVTGGLKFDASTILIVNRSYQGEHSCTPEVQSHKTLRQVSTIAICGFVWKTISSGTRAFRRRSLSLAYDSGRYNWKVIGRLACQVATDKLTASRQFPCLPSCPQYWRVTSTEREPFVG